MRDKAAYVARASKWNKANWAKVLAWRRIRSKREDVKAQTRKKAASRYAADPGYAIKRRLTGRVRAALKARQGSKKADAFINLIGCSPDMLLAHLKRQFRPGMTLENRGEWHIDHIRPCASFDLRDPEQQRACFHYTNLQPLWAIDNLQKSAKWNGRQYKRNRAA